MKTQGIDFSLIRFRSNFVTVLANYEICLARQHGQVNVLCPFHDDHNPSMTVNLESKLFHCFACQAQGDILDFVAMMENVGIVRAVELLVNICGMVQDKSEPPQLNPPGLRHHDRSRQGNEALITKHPGYNQPGENTRISLSGSLDRHHPYLFERGLTPELIKEFGLGVSSEGFFRNRVCIPIHSPDGSRVLGSSGRWANKEVPGGIPRYLLPAGFRKNQLLYNYHRAAGAPHLVIVEGYWSVFRLHALKIPAVALMGTSLSDMQVHLLVQSKARQVTLLLDADTAGRQATVKLLPLLSIKCFVHAPVLPDGSSPDDMAEDLLIEAVSSWKKP